MKHWSFTLFILTLFACGATLPEDHLTKVGNKEKLEEKIEHAQLQ